MSTNPILDRKLFKNMFERAQEYSELISPPKTKEDYMKESKELLESDYVTEKLAIRQQREEDKAMAMIAFGARLASGRGDPIDILASAAGETVPELAAMRRVTRKEETALAKAIKGEAAQIKQFALSEQKEDEIERAKAFTERFYQISDQQFQLNKMGIEQQHKLSSTVQTVWDKHLNSNVFKSLGEVLASPDRYSPDHKVGEPFELHDTWSGRNILFKNGNDYEAANNLFPGRYEGARDDVLGLKRQFMGQFTHPTTGERLNRPGLMVREMKDGSLWIPDVVEGEDPVNDRIVLDSSGHAKLIPLGKGVGDLVPLKDVEMTANDIVGPKLMNELFGQALLYQDNIDSLEVVIDRAMNQPDSVGLVGTLKYIEQVGSGILTDFLGANALSTALSNAVKEGDTFLATDDEISQDIIDKYGVNQAQQIQDLLSPDALRNNAELQTKIFGNFRPELADNRARINAIVYALARARKSTGRLNMDDIERAFRDIKITGAIDSATVATKLTTIKNELLRAHRRTRARYIKGGGPTSDILPLNYGSITTPTGAFSFSLGEDGEVLELNLGGTSATVGN